MESWKETIDKTVQQFDSPEFNLNEYLSIEQQQEEFGIIADLSDQHIRKQTIEDAKKILEKLMDSEPNTLASENYECNSLK